MSALSHIAHTLEKSGEGKKGTSVVDESPPLPGGSFLFVDVSGGLRNIPNICLCRLRKTHSAEKCYQGDFERWESNSILPSNYPSSQRLTVKLDRSKNIRFSVAKTSKCLKVDTSTNLNPTTLVSAYFFFSNVSWLSLDFFRPVAPSFRRRRWEARIR